MTYTLAKYKGIPWTAVIVGVVLVIGFLGVLGISMSMLNPLINWLLEIVHAPVYLPEA